MQEKFEFSSKFFEEGKSLDELSDFIVTFDSKLIELENTMNTEIIVNEMNTISRKALQYGALYESQSKVLQKFEDEFDMWYAEKYMEVSSANPSIKTVKEKEFRIKTQYKQEYTEIRNKIVDESYKLGILKRVCGSLDSYGMKLHSILKYRTETR